ncbi:MAG: hypothetical protein R3F30_13740 [Planctomycetota bacterium]
MRRPATPPARWATRALLALCVAGAAWGGACSSGPSIPEPYGRRVTVEMLDGDTLLLGDERVGLEEFAERMRAQVELAEQGRVEPPRVELRCRPGINAPGFVDRFVEALHRVGVRVIDIEA